MEFFANRCIAALTTIMHITRDVNLMRNKGRVEGGREKERERKI